MAKIIYRDSDGCEHVSTVPSGHSLMRGALDAGLDGILAVCGGAAACGTCRMKVDEAWLDRLPAPEDLENSMLDDEDRAARIRLSCQLVVTPDFDGLVVEIPASQF
jgi:2Fe-2S ferredoxin